MAIPSEVVDGRESVEQECLEEKLRRILQAAWPEFLSSTRESLDEMESKALEGGGGSSASLAEFQRLVHDIRGRGATFQVPVLGEVAWQFEDYLRSTKDWGEPFTDAVLHYVDGMRSALDVLEESDGPPGLKEDDLQHACTGEEGLDPPLVAFVSTSGLVNRIMEEQLAVRRHKLVLFSSPWQALRFAVLTPPSLLIASAVMDELGGVDLLLALRAMRKTANQRLALFSTLGDWREEFQALPKDVRIIRSGSEFQGDLHQALK